MILCEVENTFNILFRFVVCEQSRMWQMPIAYDFFPLLIRKLAHPILNPSSVGQGDWERELTNLTIRGLVLTPQVPLRIYNQPLSPSKALLE